MFRSRAEMILSLLERRFIASEGALREYFDDDWRPANGSSAGKSVGPGHHYEWAWLLHEYARLTGEPIRLLASGSYSNSQLGTGLTHAAVVRSRKSTPTEPDGERHRQIVGGHETAQS